MAMEDPLGELLNPRVMKGGLPALLQVPDPVLSAVAVDNVEVATAQLFALLGFIVRRDPQLVSPVDSGTTEVDSTDWSEAFRKVVAFVTWFLKDEQIREKFLSDAVDKPSALSFAHFIGTPEEPGLADDIKFERLLIWNFLIGLMMSRAMALTSGTFSSILPSRPEHIVLDAISSLTSVASGRGDAHFNAAAAMADCLSSAAKHYARVGEERERARLRATSNSVLQIHELPFLASRESHMLEKYGSKEVEVRFEQQLCLALQIYGFRTVPALKGTRQGDIICLTDTVPPTAVLVEAKTSARPYRLPVKDQRALIEYAQRLTASSWFQHPLRLICIVGPDPDRNLADRLKRLEANTHVAMRYCSATSLVGLLTRPPVGVTTEDIVEALIDADRIVSKDHLTSISSKAEEKLAAMRNSIKIYLE